MLEAEETKLHGTYQNPQGLSYRTWTFVRFNEVQNNGNLRWLFAKDQCRHCPYPPCKIMCPSPNAIIKESTGATVFYRENCVPCNRECSKTCPYEIPQFKGEINKPYKCSFCNDRVIEGKEPACAKACPTGALKFGDKTEIVAIANERVKALKATNPSASIFPTTMHNTMWVLLEEREKYQLAQESEASSVLIAFKEIVKPFGLMVLMGGLAYAAFNPLESEDKLKDNL